MKIRHGNINSHITNHPEFAGVMTALAEMYATCPDASHLRFRQALEDQMKVNIQSRGRTAGGSSEGSTWRDEQKNQFAGRGAKWVKLTGELFKLLNIQLNVFENLGEDVEDYRSWINQAGFAWVRYSGPRGSEAAQELAFEVRVGGSKIDHPKHLFRVTADVWETLSADRSVLGGTPFGMNLEVITAEASVEETVEEVSDQQ